jgi:hypothetical protein
LLRKGLPYIERFEWGQSLLAWSVSEPDESNREELGPGGVGFLGQFGQVSFFKSSFLFSTFPDDWGHQAQWKWYFMPSALESP